MSTTVVPQAAPRRWPAVGRVAIIPIGGLAILAAAYVGLSGLTKNPVGLTDASGVTAISGTYEPYGCGSRCVQGYVQAGARSVFVIFPSSCALAAGTDVLAHGRLDSSQGKATYRATDCPR